LTESFSLVVSEVSRRGVMMPEAMEPEPFVERFSREGLEIFVGKREVQRMQPKRSTQLRSWCRRSQSCDSGGGCAGGVGREVYSLSRFLA
jgi:hypothetical protein